MGEEAGQGNFQVGNDKGEGPEQHCPECSAMTEMF